MLIQSCMGLMACLVNRWLSIRFNLLSSAVVGVVALVAVISPAMSASLAGFALAFASSITNDVRVQLFKLSSLNPASSYCSWFGVSLP
jgi:hypothetical protein